MTDRARTAKQAQHIIIDHGACKGCLLCVDQCPHHVLEISQTRNAKGYLMPTAARIHDCVLCRVCEMICPDLAIYVEVLNGEK